MCASCNGAESNGHANGSAANGANGTNGNNHEGYTSIQSSQRNSNKHKSSPYAPVGDFLSNVSRFKIIGTSFSFQLLMSAIGGAHKRNLPPVFELAARRD